MWLGDEERLVDGYKVEGGCNSFKKVKTLSTLP